MLLLLRLSLFSCVRLSVTPWTAAHQAPLSMGFSRQEHWSGQLCPPPGGLPDPGIKSASLMSPAAAGRFFTTSTTWEAQSFHTLTDFQKCHIFNHNLFYFLLSTRNTKMNDMDLHPQEVSRLAEDALHKALPNMCRTLYSLDIQTALQKSGT